MGNRISEKEFIAWMVTQPNRNGKLYLERVVRHYIRCMRTAPKKLKLQIPVKTLDVFSYTNLEDFEYYYKALVSAPNFKKVDHKSSHNSFSAGLMCYKRYLEYLSFDTSRVTVSINKPIDEKVIPDSKIISDEKISNNDWKEIEALQNEIDQTAFDDHLIKKKNLNNKDEYYKASGQQPYSTQYFIRSLVSISENEDKIVIESYGFDTAKITNLFFNSEESIKSYSSENASKVITVELVPFTLNTYTIQKQKLIQMKNDLFLDYYNKTVIQFRNSSELLINDIYDRLIYSLTPFYDYLLSNEVLSEIKEFIYKIEPTFLKVKLLHLIESKLSFLNNYSISIISDILLINSWNLSVAEARLLQSLIVSHINNLIIPSKAIKELLSTLSEREIYVIENRYLKSEKTLSEIGDELNLTRERVRQIAAKVQRKFGAPKKSRIIRSLLFTLKSLCECKYCFTINELKEYYLTESGLGFLIESLGSSYSLIHITDTDIIALGGKNGKCDWLNKVEKFSLSIPKLVLPEEQDSLLIALSTELNEIGYDIPDKYITSILYRNYNSNGSILIKKSFSLADKYAVVLEKYFPNGIRPSNAEEMDVFRQKYNTLFNDERIPDNDHAVAARIADKCILVGRGIYIYDKKTELPDALVENILSFIQKYPGDMVMTNAIMHKFHNELYDAGVENKYYLHSVLKKYFANKFSFKRDYVVKGMYSGNFYGIVSDYVKSHAKGISFYDLQNHFVGVSDAVLYFALFEDDNIIPMYNKMYIHKEHINFSEKNTVLEFLKDTIYKEHIVSDDYILKLLKKNFPDFIANNNINTSWFLFSILRSYFSEEFNFSRPHIIDLAVDSANGHEALKSYFWGSDYVSISEIKRYAKDKNIYIFDLSKLLNSYNDRYFIFNKEKLVSIEEIGYSLKDYEKTEETVIAALGDLEFADISRLNIVNKLPKANIEITEWIIYSIIHKHGTQLSVTTSTPYFSKSKPIVLYNNVDIETVREYFSNQEESNQDIKIYNLNDIDNLIAEIVEADIIIGEG